jgi:hypothetical protein
VIGWAGKMAYEYFKEECWFLYGYRISLQPFSDTMLFIGYQKYHAIGSAVRVEMDYSQAANPRVIGWYHTHPYPRGTAASATDNSTMRSWVKSMYRSYLCGIRCGYKSSCYCYSVDGINKKKCTIVKKTKIDIQFFGNFFVSLVGGR